MKDSMDGRWRDVMTVVSGRGAHVLLLEAVMVTRLSVTVTALLRKVLMLDVLMRKVKVFVVMMMMGVFLSLSSSSPPTLTTRPCGACLAQNIATAGDPLIRNTPPLRTTIGLQVSGPRGWQFLMSGVALYRELFRVKGVAVAGLITRGTCNINSEHGLGV